MIETPESTIARRVIQDTNSCLLIIGKAGTGKTTFLKSIVENSGKKIAVVAPSGISALKAGGRTIHSLLGFKTEPFVPGSFDKGCFLTPLEKNYIRMLDTLIIDEISMVRADLIDHMDVRLKSLRYNEKPFGGLQIIMMGDLRQLPPVVDKDDEKIVSKYYDSPFFFSAKVFKRMTFPVIEFSHVFRQNDEAFVNMLNRLRDKNFTQDDLDALNDRVSDKEPLENVVRLVTHKYQANRENNKMLERLSSKDCVYEAEISGYFYCGEYPVPKILRLRIGAKVMFVINDKEDRFVNGTMGRVVSLNDDTVSVRIDGTGNVVTVRKSIWKNTVYEFDAKKNETFSRDIGSYSQIPLILAWAVTVHKSQGQTFDEVNVNLKQCFAAGQAYVALSRCRSLEGITMVEPISTEIILTDNQVDQYLKKVRKDWSLENVENYVENYKPDPSMKCIYDVDKVYNKIEEFRQTEAKRLQTTKNKIISKREIAIIAHSAPQSIDEMKSLKVDGVMVDDIGYRLLRIIESGFSQPSIS